MKQKSSSITYRTLFREQDFRTLTLANMVNRLGDAIDLAAYAWITYAVTGSPSWTAFITGVNLLPNILIEPFAGAFVEKLSKKKVILTGDLFRGILTFFIGFLYMQELLNPWILLCCTFLNNTSESFTRPARTAWMPALLPKQFYTFGVSLQQMVNQGVQLVGAALGGLFLSIFGPHVSLFIDGGTFLLSAALIFKIRGGKEASSCKAPAKSSYAQTLKEGFSYIRKHPFFLHLCLIGAIINALIIPYQSFEAPIVQTFLRLGPLGLSLGGGFCVAGAFLGAFAYPYVSQKYTNRHLFLFGLGLYALFYPGIFLLTCLDLISVSAIGLSFFSILAGISGSLLSAILSTAFISRIEEGFLARMSGIMNGLLLAASPLTSFFLSYLSRFFSVKSLLLVCGLFTLALFLAMINHKLLKTL